MYKSTLILKLLNPQNVRHLFSSNILLDSGVPTPAEPSLSGSSANYLEAMYNAWLQDPQSVHVSWNAYFQSTTGASSAPGYIRPPTFTPQVTLGSVGSAGPAPSATTTSSSPQSIQEHLLVQSIVKSYQSFGHFVAKTNPLDDMFDVTDKSKTISDLIGHPPKEIVKDLSPSMLSNTYHLPPSTLIGGTDSQLPLKEIIKRLELTYCRHIGLEYMHLESETERQWMRERFETPGKIQLTKEEKRLILNRLARAVLFEGFLQKKWSSEKRFGLEGCESLIPCIKTIIDETSKNAGEMVVIGMAHRGRLNVLANVCMKPLDLIFAQFRGLEAEDKGAGDVKYHLGVYNKRELPTTKKQFITVLIANPSHLEMVNPVVAGRVRAEQFFRNDSKGAKVVPIIIHGDAAFAGEGIVYETINFSQLKHYHNGGTIHIIANNQVGFTTDPPYSRSSRYSSDVGKVVNSPIFHINADDPDSVVYATKIATEFRNTFQKDVVIDIIGYRRHGHNEADEPMFTQPEMYLKIKEMPNVFEKYSKIAVKDGTATQEEVSKIREELNKIMENEFAKASKETKMRFSDWIDSPWPDFFKNPLPKQPTGAPLDVLQHVAKKFSELPSGEFTVHKALQRVFTQRQEMVKHSTADWALGEALAIGSLLKDKIHVRLSGEDVERGTFSHRHHLVHNQVKPFQSHTYLKDLFPDQATYSICNSPISEFGILGFEHGYSMTKPDCLVIWEAQFGDFANNAQPLYDCMIASGEWKWIRQCGLVSLLPHGLEGQGPEHSSARIERFLQMSNEEPDYLPPDSSEYEVEQLRDINWIVANCTTPANLFHILRRQVKVPFRKPLLIFTPKSLLRHPEARSTFEEMTESIKYICEKHFKVGVLDSHFQRVIPERGVGAENPKSVQKLVFICGKFYYDVKNFVADKKLADKIAIARLEQVCPFPFDLVQNECKKYSEAQIAWVQEEHKNSGCWTYVLPRFETALKGERDIMYIGRAPSASTASGNKIQYLKELEAVLGDIIKNCE